MRGKQKKVPFVALAQVMLILSDSYTSRASFLDELPEENTSDQDVSEDIFLEMLPASLYRLLVENRTDDTIAQYCPGLMKCSVASNSAISSPQPLTDASVGELEHGCCLQCECHPNCFAKGTCCSDLEPLRSEQPDLGKYTQDSRTCVDTLIKHFERYHTSQDKLYLLGQTCLERSQIYTKRNNDTAVFNNDTILSSGFVNVNGDFLAIDEVIDRCLFPIKLDVLDATPVTSLTSKKSYRNVFCAYCNNDGVNLVDWDMSLNCFSVEGLPKVNEIANRQEVFTMLLREKLCSINWDPPQEFPVDNCFPPEYMISGCPTYVPHYLDRLCKDQSYFFPYRGSFAVYRNVFCLVCNFYRTEELVYDPPENGLCPHDQNVIGVVMPFSAVLDFKSLSTVKYEEQVLENDCEAGLMYNAVTDLCLELMCPFHEFKLADRCISVVKQLIGVTLQFQINFIFDIKKQVLPNYVDLMETGENIALTATNGDYADICEVDIIETSLTEKSIEISLYIATKLYKPASLSEVYERFERTLDIFNNAQVVSGNNFTVKMRDTDLASFDPSYSRFISFNRGSNCQQLAAISKLQICRLVVFQNYVMFNRNLISISGLQFNSAEFFRIKMDNVTQPRVAICEETFVKKVQSRTGMENQNQKTSNGDKGKSTGNPKLTLICVVLYYNLFRNM